MSDQVHPRPRMDPVHGDGSATVGITVHAQDALGDVVFVDLPEVGKAFAPQGDGWRGRVGQGRRRRVHARDR